jgi:trans-aconitate 2-methyltransferase
MWDPVQYRLFGDERSRPFYELVGRIAATNPRLVADIGCGPGELTADLSRRWPAADVLGVDSSAEMISAAHELLAKLPQQAAPPRLRFELQDALEWQPSGPVDVIVSNALLQWIPGHEKLVVRWARLLADDGWLAFQLPGNYGEPTHRRLRELARSDRWSRYLSEVTFNRQAGDTAEYLRLLAGEGCAVDAWETTYLHVLAGEDATLRWIQGTGLRPVIAALEPGPRAEFMAEYGALLRKDYPQEAFGTVFPFRRVFVVAHKKQA